MNGLLLGYNGFSLMMPVENSQSKSDEFPTFVFTLVSSVQVVVFLGRFF